MSVVRLKTNHGDIDVTLDAGKAPKTVENFLQYVKDKHYDGTIFHRVIHQFMIQGGGFMFNMTQKPIRKPIDNEATNGLKNQKYSLSMARTSDPHSATSQFFINTVDNAFLDFTAPNPRGWGYCVFAKVTAGFDVVDKIGGVKTISKGGHDDVPQETVLIESATLLS